MKHGLQKINFQNKFVYYDINNNVINECPATNNESIEVVKSYMKFCDIPYAELLDKEGNVIDTAGVKKEAPFNKLGSER